MVVGFVHKMVGPDKVVRGGFCWGGGNESVKDENHQSLL